MSDKAISQFPRMGDELVGQVVNLSGERSPYTKLVSSQATNTNIGPDSVGGHAGQMLIGGEVQGPKFAPQTTLPGGQAAEAAMSGRNVKIMPANHGVSHDFYAKRAEGPIIG